jgi:hypothetical protein
LEGAFSFLLFAMALDNLPPTSSFWMQARVGQAGALPKSQSPPQPSTFRPAAYELEFEAQEVDFFSVAFFLEDPTLSGAGEDASGVFFRG